MPLLARLSLACLLVLGAAPAHAQTPADEIAALKQAIDLVQRGKTSEALAASSKFHNGAARSLVTWLAIRMSPKDVGFERAAQFLRERPQWPSQSLMRRRVERLLYDDRRDPASVRAFFAGSAPISGEGKLALARALLAGGDRVGALLLVRSAWHEHDFGKDVEEDALKTFPGMLGRDDHKLRADRFFYNENVDAGLRAAARAGADVAALARAWAAVIQRKSNAATLLAAVPASLKSDPSLLFARIQYRRRRDDMAGAVELMNQAPHEPAKLVDTDAWWRERRILVRAMLDKGNARMAYKIANDAALPDQENYKADQHFTAGWIALRYLNDPATAHRHFARIPEFSIHPLTLARGYYWLGRAAEAANDRVSARKYYEAAGKYPTAYYGQLARARLDWKDFTLYRPRPPSAEERARFERQEHIAALRLLYAIGENDLIIPIYLDLAERADATNLALLGALASEMNHARAMVAVGKAAYNSGHLFDTIAFPTFGIPKFNRIGPETDLAVVYAVARQESQFEPKALSTAKAMGLMQVIAPTGRAVAKRNGVAFSVQKLRDDPVYNVQIGAAELADLLQAYRGSYILAFAGYNAGRGRVSEWIARYGDPRDPKVDPIDWIERIPFSETRYYIQRVLENLQVYRLLLGGNGRLMIEADLSRGRVN